uniref:Uncharacterized protein n=1 Tax=Arundo donax TaxID=35708 RepID=A0A0A9TM30_ARUDO
MFSTDRMAKYNVKDSARVLAFVHRKLCLRDTIWSEETALACSLEVIRKSREKRYNGKVQYGSQCKSARFHAPDRMFCRHGTMWQNERHTAG